MILKVILVIVVIATVYFIFIKKKPIAKPVKRKKEKKKKRVSDELIPCAKCGTYVSVNDAFIKSARYYCSQECMNE